MLAKVFTSAYCVLVGLILFYTQQIGAAILETAVTSLENIGAASAERLGSYSGAPLAIGGALQTTLVVLIVVFQLAITWSKK